MNKTRWIKKCRPNFEALGPRTVAAVSHASLIHGTLVRSKNGEE